MTMHTEASPKTSENPKRTRRTGPYKAADARRQAILDAAIQHFAQWGYFNSSIPKIAADVGMTKAGLIHHFGSKDALLLAVLELREQRALQAFYGEEPQDASIQWHFRQIAAQAAFNEREVALTQMFSVLVAEASNPEHPAHSYFQARYDSIIRSIAEMLTRMVEAGNLLPGTDVQQVASEILAVEDGFTIQWALGVRSTSLTKRVTTYLDRLAKSISTDGSGIAD